MLDDTTMSHHNPFPQDSKLYFRVVERTNAWIDRHGKAHNITKQKSLVRETDTGPQWLANVGENYKTIENRELFPHVERHLLDVLDPMYTQNVNTIEHMSYGGRDCYREYQFPDLKCDVGGRGDVAFRLIVGNSYGAKSVTLLSGAIDFFCTNGMIIGSHEKQARRHTSGLEVTGLDNWINNSVSQFVAHGKRIERYNDTMIDLTKEDGLFEYLRDKGLLSERHARAAQARMHTERNQRSGRDVQPSLWDLYSAMTHWASHDDIRDTGNDHEANTRIQRTQHAERVIRAADAYMDAQA